MRLRRLYYPLLLQDQQSYTLVQADSQFHYLANVLRVKAGQTLELFNGQGLQAQAEVTTVAKKNMQIVVSSIDHQTAPRLQLHLYLSVSKGDRMDYALQKSTELGVSQITPVWSARVEVKLKAERLVKKQNHWQGVITSACEQAFNNFVPVLNEPQSLDNIQADTNGLAFVCDASGQPMSEYESEKPTQVEFFVGPEGGWTAEELELLHAKQVKPLKLGPRILRTETAPVAMLSLAQYLWGDF